MQFGGRYGKTPENSNGPMSQGKEIEDGDGVSHKKDGGLKIEFNWEKQNNNQFADRKSTRLNSSHDQISYAVFCLKKKKIGVSHQQFA